MNKKIVGKINSAPVAVLLLSVIANVATDLKITVKDKIKGQKIAEVDLRSAKDSDIQKLIEYLTGDESYRYSIEFEALTPLPYVNKEFFETFNVPNCCQIQIL